MLLLASRKPWNEPPIKLIKDESKVKLVYKLDEVSRLTSVDADTLATWEEEFPFLSAGLTGSGEKFFRQQDVDIIGRIKELMAGKTLTMAGIKRRIEEEFGLVRSAARSIRRSFARPSTTSATSSRTSFPRSKAGEKKGLKVPAFLL